MRLDIFTLDDIVDYEGKRVLMRVEYNVKFKNSKIVDTTRIDASLETIRYLLDRGAKVVLMAHNGRPGGEYNKDNSLEPIAGYLRGKLGCKVVFAEECIGEKAEDAVGSIGRGEIVLLENLRFKPGEKGNDPEFIEALSSLGDIYVNNSFGTVHNTESSSVGVPKYFREHRMPIAAGRLIQEEINMLKVLLEPQGYSVGIIGGAKVKDKIGVVKRLAKQYKVCIGGAMANTFLKAKDYEIGDSFVDNDYVDEVRALMGHYPIGIPVDVVVAEIINKDNIKGGKLKKEDYQNVRVVDLEEDQVRAFETILDIGPRTVKLYGGEIGKARTVVWNGPMGYFEQNDFSEGTKGVARLIGESDADTKIAGGGESIIAIHGSGYADNIRLSTGGGAMLRFIEKEGQLPGIIALLK